MQSLTRLAPLTQLRELDIGENVLHRFPREASTPGSLLPHCALHAVNARLVSSCPLLQPQPRTRRSLQVSALTNLRILYLHKTLGLWAEVPADAWEALRPLSALLFLSISGNSLYELPPVVAGMTQLRVSAVWVLQQQPLLEGLAAHS